MRTFLELIIVSSPPFCWGERTCQKLLLEGMTIFALFLWKGYILGEAFVWGEQLFFLSFFVFVILWYSVNK